MKDTIEPRLFKCVCNTFNLRLTLILLWSFECVKDNIYVDIISYKKSQKLHSWQCCKLIIPSFFVKVAIGASLCMVCLENLDYIHVTVSWNPIETQIFQKKKHQFMSFKSHFDQKSPSNGSWTRRAKNRNFQILTIRPREDNRGYIGSHEVTWGH